MRAAGRFITELSDISKLDSGIAPFGPAARPLRSSSAKWPLMCMRQGIAGSAGSARRADGRPVTADPMRIRAFDAFFRAVLREQTGHVHRGRRLPARARRLRGRRRRTRTDVQRSYDAPRRLRREARRPRARRAARLAHRGTRRPHLVAGSRASPNRPPGGLRHHLVSRQRSQLN